MEKIQSPSGLHRQGYGTFRGIGSDNEDQCITHTRIRRIAHKAQIYTSLGT
jgi:hypothetical protein